MIGPTIQILSPNSQLSEGIPVRVEQIVEEVGCLLDRGPPGGSAEVWVLIIPIATVRGPVTKILDK